MKADLPLEERQRIEAESQREIRDALVRRHEEVIEYQRAISEAHLAHAVAVLSRPKPEAHSPTNVAATATVAAPAPSGDNLRSALGLR